MKFLSVNKILFTLLFFVVSIQQIKAQEDCFPKQSNPPLMVEDRAEILTPKQRIAIENYLRAFQDSTSNQILLLTVKSLCDYDKAEFATEIGHKWGVGQKKFDNGIVILIKPKLNRNDKGEAYIAVGYGLEGIIPDAIAFEIVNREMIPYFKNGDYYSGIAKGINTITKLASQEITSDEYAYKGRSNKKDNKFGFFLLVLVVVIVLSILKNKGNNGGGNNRGRRNGDNDLIWLLPFLMGGRSRGSTFGSSGGFSSGGFGGGFGGFGGGGFGGGGAGGSW